MAGDTIKAAQALKADPDLKSKVQGAGHAAAKRQVLADAGHSGFEPEQGETWKKASQGVELSDEDLSRIAGGESTSSVISNAVSDATLDVCEDAADAFA